MQINEKTALITGASRGIGRAIALELAEQGMTKLILVARDRSRLAIVAEEIESIHPQIEVVKLAIDLTDTVNVHIAIAQAWRDHGPIDLLVNCAGVAHQTPFLQSQPSQFEAEISLNLVGMFTITRLVAKRMASQKCGVIVNVSSLMGKVAVPTMSTYSATKFAIIGFTQALRRELAPYNIRAIALLPTLTDTDMIRDFQLFRWVMPMTAEQVAKALVSGLEKDSAEILVGWQSHLAVLCQRYAPWLFEKILNFASPPLQEA